MKDNLLNKPFKELLRISMEFQKNLPCPHFPFYHVIKSKQV